jgi:hypothetical protein
MLLMALIAGVVAPRPVKAGTVTLALLINGSSGPVELVPGATTSLSVDSNGDDTELPDLTVTAYTGADCNGTGTVIATPAGPVSLPYTSSFTYEATYLSFSAFSDGNASPSNCVNATVAPPSVPAPTLEVQSDGSFFLTADGPISEFTITSFSDAACTTPVGTPYTLTGPFGRFVGSAFPLPEGATAFVATVDFAGANGTVTGTSACSQLFVIPPPDPNFPEDVTLTINGSTTPEALDPGTNAFRLAWQFNFGSYRLLSFPQPGCVGEPTTVLDVFRPEFTMSVEGTFTHVATAQSYQGEAATKGFEASNCVDVTTAVAPPPSPPASPSVSPSPSASPSPSLSASPSASPSLSADPSPIIRPSRSSESASASASADTSVAPSTMTSPSQSSTASDEPAQPRASQASQTSPVPGTTTLPNTGAGASNGSANGSAMIVLLTILSAVVAGRAIARRPASLR